MKIELSILIYVLTLSLVFSQGQEKVNIEKILIKQIKSGPGSEYWGEDDYYTKQDLDALISIEDTILKNNGYKIPEKETFNQKIKNIFERIIDNKSENSYLKVDKHDKCNKAIDYQPVYTGIDYIYVDKNHRFITTFYSLPSILDYQKIYPDVSKYEEKPFNITYVDGTKQEISRWKDLKNMPKERRFNQQLLLSRNKYLFNDDPSQFAWLTNNDEDFMQSLVTTFGYTEDKKLLKWVMEKNYNKAGDFVKDYVFVKNCQNKLEIREDILKYIESSTNDKEYQYAKQLLNLSDRNDWKNFSDEEYFKILAYMANTFDPLSEKYSEVGMETHAKWSILGKEYYERKPEQWNQLIKEFKKNNYYGLPNLKHALKQAESYGDISIEVAQ